MKVLFVTREYPPFEVGGIAVHTFNLVKHLKKLNVCCRVLSFGDPKCSNSEVTFIEPSSSILYKSNASAALDVKIPLDILRLTHVANRLLKQEMFDVVHVQEPYVGAFVKHKCKLTTVHDTSYSEIRTIMRQPLSFSSIKRSVFFLFLGVFFEISCIASSRTVIVPSEQVKHELASIYATPKRKLSVLLNGVEISAAQFPSDKALAKKKLGLDTGKLLIFTAARQVERKRINTLISAIKVMQNENLPEYSVIVAGDGPIRPQLINLAEKSGLSGTIAFPGWVSREKLDLYYQAADVFVLTSDFETGPISLLEAMAYGDAVVSTRIQVFPSLMRDRVDGLLFEVADYRKLSKHLITLLTDKSLLKRLSFSARSFAERFDWETVAKKTLRYYQNLCTN
ncbi:MAG: glycosyltransferase family 4 protein [Candidatus Bathyarchaeota archaeon]|nr:glycosyltransferase family 4 protein [Candidatus Bathyarchaeota archaeon]